MDEDDELRAAYVRARDESDLCLERLAALLETMAAAHRGGADPPAANAVLSLLELSLAQMQTMRAAWNGFGQLYHAQSARRRIPERGPLH
jgi:hypothetical protein